ncbi:MAG: hypothetical protein D6689_18465 [Deltaproteobacteria bacterium]|nr:MAG: hypothetical protein D6689_18465 [Deltaproteobacteria bacterium]
MARAAAAVASVLAAACVAGGGGDGGGDGLDADLADYDALVAELDQHRTLAFDERADELRAVGSRLYWLEFPTFDPVLHSQRDGVDVTYAFSISIDDDYAYEASDNVVVTIELGEQEVVYRAYAAGEPDRPLGTLTVPKPPAARWWAFAVHAGDVYLAMDVDGAHSLVQWTPPDDPVALWTFARAGITGSVDALATDGDRLVAIESGRVWLGTLAGEPATWLGNDKQITGGIGFDDRYVVYAQADGVRVYRIADGVTSDLSERVAASDFRINDTFATAHHFARQARLHKGTVVYIGQSGLFAYDLDRDRVTPLMLEPRTLPGGARIVYDDPQVTADGTVYVTALTSDSGSVGVDGPVYAVPLPAD